MSFCLKTTIALTALGALVMTSSIPARADDGGAVAAGVAGGLLGGLLLGGAVAPRPYYGPAPVYVEPPPPPLIAIGRVASRFGTTIAASGFARALGSANNRNTI